jgi:hypothetical protein
MSIPEKPEIQNKTVLRRIGVGLTVIGLLIFLLGAEPGLFGLDHSIAIGFIQIAVFSIGLVVICLGGTLSLNSLWPNHYRTIAGMIGVRLAWTGLIFALISALADMLGMGTRPFPYYQPFFGFWQARGVIAGQVLMIIGFLMMVPYRVQVEEDGGTEESSQ